MVSISCHHIVVGPEQTLVPGLYCPYSTCYTVGSPGDLAARSCTHCFFHKLCQFGILVSRLHCVGGNAQYEKTSIQDYEGLHFSVLWGKTCTDTLY